MKADLEGASTITVNFVLNGEPQHVDVDTRRTLADLLRDDLGLTGTHLGCEHGVCGACTVLVDGRSARACVMLAVQVEGREVTTIEGLSPHEGLSPLQQAMSEHGGLQCGFCTPGIVIAATELLRDDPDVDEAGVRSALSGNLCRCTGYEGIVDAVLSQRGIDPGAPPIPPDELVEESVASPTATDDAVAERPAGSGVTALARRSGQAAVLAAILALAIVVWRRRVDQGR